MIHIGWRRKFQGSIVGVKNTELRNEFVDASAQGDENSTSVFGASRAPRIVTGEDHRPPRPSDFVSACSHPSLQIRIKSDEKQEPHLLRGRQPYMLRFQLKRGIRTNGRQEAWSWMPRYVHPACIRSGRFLLNEWKGYRHHYLVHDHSWCGCAGEDHDRFGDRPATHGVLLTSGPRRDGLQPYGGPSDPLHKPRRWNWAMETNGGCTCPPSNRVGLGI